MHAIIDPKCLSHMVSTLENDELGAAIRLLNRIITSGRPVPLSRAKTVSQMSPDQWDVSSQAVLDHFICANDEITHSALEASKLPAVASRPKTRAGVTSDMPIVHPTRQHRVPVYTDRKTPELISMKKTAYIMMTEIFKRSDQSENTARAVLASLLKNWPEGDVYEAISAADKQKYIVDPRSWIVAHLQRSSRPLVAARGRRETCPPPKKSEPRQLVTPEAMGVSQATAERIRKKNASLGLTIGVKREEA